MFNKQHILQTTTFFVTVLALSVHYHRLQHLQPQCA